LPGRTGVSVAPLPLLQAGGCLLGVTASVALALVPLKAKAPPVPLGAMCWPGMPCVASQASQVRVAVPELFTVGSKQSTALLGSSNTEASDSEVGTLYQTLVPGSS
jgi:hypothetical protein